MIYFDLHCDTLLEAFSNNKTLYDNGFHIDLSKTGDLEDYTQVLAVYSRNRDDPDVIYDRFFRVMDYYEKIRPSDPRFHAVFGVEGGKLLNGDITRLDRLHEKNVKILTLVWGGECCIGGAHDTSLGLTPFGYEVLFRLWELGMIPDVSHASFAMTRQVLDEALKRGKPVIASHSCSYAIHPHTRNLRDEDAKDIASLGGLIGTSVVTFHLCGDQPCTVETMTDHIVHYLSVCGEDTPCMGSDFDGTDGLPEGLDGIGSIGTLYDSIASRTHSQRIADKVFYENAQAFSNRYFK